MFNARRIHTTIWDVIQGRHQRGENMDLNIRTIDSIAVGVPFFVPNQMRSPSCLGEPMNDKNWVDRYLMREPILIDFEEHGIMVIRNESKGIEWFASFDDMELDPNLYVSNKHDTLHYGVALFNVHFDVVDRTGTAQDLYAKTNAIVKNAMDVASAAGASVDALRQRHPFAF